jgi:hypothetical protein
VHRLRIEHEFDLIFAMASASSFCQGLAHGIVSSGSGVSRRVSVQNRHAGKAQRQCAIFQLQHVITACAPHRRSSTLPVASRRVCRCQASGTNPAGTTTASSGGKVRARKSLISLLIRRFSAPSSFKSILTLPPFHLYTDSHFTYNSHSSTCRSHPCVSRILVLPGMDCLCCFIYRRLTDRLSRRLSC